MHNTTARALSSFRSFCSCKALTAVALAVAVATPIGAMLGALPASAQTADDGAWAPIAPTSRLIVQTWKDGPAARLAHDHAIMASVYNGKIRYQPDAADPLAVDVTVDARRLIVDDDGARRAVGLEPGVPAKDKAEVYKSMTGPEQLDVARFPTIRFVSTSSARRDDGSILLKGTLTLHGQSRAVSLPVRINDEDGGPRGRGTLMLKTSDYGVAPYSAFFGAVQVKDDVKLHLDLRLAAQQ